jgi:hypothetical protein
MGIKRTIGVISAMEADGIIGRYAITGAFAAFYYVEATVTEDLDILVSFDQPSSRPASGLITLEPIFLYLQKKGYREHRKEGIVIEGWPVQFLPVAGELDVEALAQSREIEVPISDTEGPVKTRVLRPEHIVAKSLQIGRPKDFLRIAQFIEGGAVEMRALSDVLVRHGLEESWQNFCKRAGIHEQSDLHRRT